MATGGFSYDVFLSFRGETRKNFTDHLYTALKQAGIRTFRDDDAMERGKLLGPELKKAIHESAISLLVFSEDYASSEWCLNEVLMSVEEHETLSSKHEVVPVFYKVKPSDVRYQTGSFKKTFDDYDDEIKAELNLEKQRELLEKVGRWRDALRKAATLTGMVLLDGYESKFINNIVNVVIKKVDNKALHIDEKLVGIQDHLAEIGSWLQDPSPDAVILLLDGMGGIGKSTIAKCIFNSNFRNYDASCFLADINKESSNQTSGLCRLQRQLLSTVLRSENEETIWNVDEGTNKVTNAISNKRVFLILDDVATLEQLDALLGPKRFYPGSKVIITTRHTWLLTAFKDGGKVHSVGTLSTADATELFSLHAFHQLQPVEPYISQSQIFVDHCKGLPLALKVSGSSLRGKTLNEWKDTMCQLAANPDPDIQEVLEISYKTLKHGTDKELFLHIACFFEGEKVDYIVKLLCDLHPVVGIKNLIDRCLLYVDEYDARVKMHQLIKDMGREVVYKESPKEPGKRSRLWNHQDCIDVLQDQSGTEKVDGFVLHMHGNNVILEIKSLEEMKNLMLLQLNYVTFSGKCKKWPRKLRLLRWHGCTLKAIPSDICLEKLVVLDMSHSKLKLVWDNYKLIGSLKILNLSHSRDLIETPNFGGLPGLESLILEGCSSLIKVHESIAFLKVLVVLDLTDCTNLREFPCMPTSLVTLEMSGCGVLALGHSLDSVQSFSLLVEMNLSYCNLFDNSFPNDWSGLVSLEYLDISGANVTSLPKCIQTLPKIQSLAVDCCLKIQSIIGLPKSLSRLYARGNESLEKVQLTHNSRVFHKNCPKLCEMGGPHMVQSIDKVERKVIQYLGLEPNVGEGMELGLKVLSLSLMKTIKEPQICASYLLPGLGIFSTLVSGKQIPSMFMYKERGPQISFQVPCHDDSSRIGCFNMCVVLSQLRRSESFCLMIQIYNKTKGLWWEYGEGDQKIPKNAESYAWLSLWRCDDLLEGGNEIVIDIVDRAGGLHNLHRDVEECRVNIIYEENELIDGERKEARHVDASWITAFGCEKANIPDVHDFDIRHLAVSPKYRTTYDIVRSIRHQGQPNLTGSILRTL